MLVFEYSPNGNVCSHLYGNMWLSSEIRLWLFTFFSETLHLLLDSGKGSMTRLEFKQRLAIAIGAAKGSTTMRRRLFFSVMNLENSKYNCSLTCRSESSA